MKSILNNLKGPDKNLVFSRYEEILGKLPYNFLQNNKLNIKEYYIHYLQLNYNVRFVKQPIFEVFNYDDRLVETRRFTVEDHIFNKGELLKFLDEISKNNKNSIIHIYLTNNYNFANLICKTYVCKIRLVCVDKKHLELS